ncbi:MAG: hypothetical protein AAGK22_05540 [Acidobacteriota bacterium]
MNKPSVLEAVKIQSRVLIPIVRALEQELGQQQAHRIVGDAIAESRTPFRWAREMPSDHPPGADEPDLPIETRVMEESEERYGFDVMQCDFRWHKEEAVPPEAAS